MESTKILLVVAVVALVVAIIGLTVFCAIKRRQANKPIRLSEAVRSGIKGAETMGTMGVFDLDDTSKPQYNARNDNELNLENLVSRPNRKGKNDDLEQVQDTSMNQN